MSGTCHRHNFLSGRCMFLEARRWLRLSDLQGPRHENMDDDPRWLEKLMRVRSCRRRCAALTCQGYTAADRTVVGAQ